MTCAGTSSCDGDVDASLPYFDREVRVIGLLLKKEDDGLVVVVRGEKLATLILFDRSNEYHNYSLKSGVSTKFCRSAER